MADGRGLQLGSRAMANTVRGLGGSLPLALVAPALAHRLPGDDFAVWVLVVQVSSYVTYLEFGVQTAVSRTVAFRAAGGAAACAAGPIAAGVRLLTRMAAIGLLLVTIAVIALPYAVSIPDGLVSTARIALLVLGGTAAIALPGSAIHGALVGAGHHWSSAVTVVLARSISVGLTVLGAWLGWPVTTLAVCLALGSIANGAGPFFAARRAKVPAGGTTPTASDLQEVRSITTTVGTWTIATLIISGLDVLVVGIVDYDRVAPYGLAAGLVIVAAATYGILASILIPAFADQAAREDHAGARLLLTRTTASSTAVLATGLIVGLAFRERLLSVWADDYADRATPIFIVLLITAAIRLAMSPIGSFVMGYGQHRLVRSPAITESTLNLALSVTFGATLGAIGVAIGSLVASGSAVMLYLGRVGPAAVGRPAFRQLVLPQYLWATVAAAPFVGAILLAPQLGQRVVIGAFGVLLQLTVLRRSLNRLSPGDAAAESDTESRPLRGDLSP